MVRGSVLMWLKKTIANANDTAISCRNTASRQGLGAGRRRRVAGAARPRAASPR